MYNQKILDIFKNPTNAGGLHGANAIGKYVEQTFGDVSKVYLKIDENKNVAESRFKAMGGVLTIVACSVVCELAKNKQIDELNEITVSDVLEVIGEVEPEKLVFVQGAVEALKLAVVDFYKKLEKEQKNA